MKGHELTPQESAKLWGWYRATKERFLNLEQDGNPPVFYTGTSKKRSESIQMEGFQQTSAADQTLRPGVAGVWFYGIDGTSISTEEGAVAAALSHSRVKVEADDSEPVILRFNLPVSEIILDYPYYAFYTTRPELIEIIDMKTPSVLIKEHGV